MENQNLRIEKREGGDWMKVKKKNKNRVTSFNIHINGDLDLDLLTADLKV